MTDTNHHVLTGKVDITSNLLVGSSHLFVDTNNNRVGLITTNPDAGLHVNSNAYVNTDLRVGSQIEINATAGRIKAGSFEGDGSLLENVPAGADGAAATIAVGTTTPGPVGTTTASVTNSGSSSAAVFDFVIPRGEQGAAGTNGTNGTNYFTLSGSNIYRTTGNVGIGTTNPSQLFHVHRYLPTTSHHVMARIGGDTSSYNTLVFGSKEGRPHIGGHRGDFGTWADLSLQDDAMIIQQGGNVGIGTTSPGQPLDVQYNSDSGIRSKGTGYNHASVYIDAGTGYGYLRFQHSGTDKFWIQSTPAGDLAFRPSGGGHVMDILNNGNVGVGYGAPAQRFAVNGDAWINTQLYVMGHVGVGTNTPYAKLHVQGGTGYVSGSLRRYFNYSSPSYMHQNVDYATTGTMSIYCDSAICTSSYFIAVSGTVSASDERIKKDIVDVEDDKALNIIRLLKPKKYRYKDEINRGVEPVWGFIAQEVNDILPEAIKIGEECIPNIYELANVSTSNVITFTNFDTSILESNASVLKVFDEDDNEHLLTIDQVIDEHSIRVKEDRTESQLFIYGQRINDFHHIRKETVWTVATAALQEVDRQLQTTKEELQSEKDKVATMELLVASLVKRVGDLENLVI